MPDNPIRLAVLVSGSGTTLQNLIDQICQRKLNATICIVIGSRAELPALEKAKKAGLHAAVIDRREYLSLSEFSRLVFEHCTQAGAELVCLGGWLCLLEIPPAYDGKVMNIHPALLPSFGGAGMYGPKVHQAVLDHGCKISGCTVHFVDATYDNGPIILQRCCPVLETDTAQTLAQRVFEEEKVAYPQAIRLYQARRLRIEGRRVKVLPEV